MKKILCLFLVFSVSNAHAYLGTWNDPLKSFDATKNQYNKVNIEWVVSADVVKDCNKENNKWGFAPLGALTACAFWSGNTCKIITSRTPTMHEIGHEVRHCFQGAWH